MEGKKQNHKNELTLKSICFTWLMAVVLLAMASCGTRRELQPSTSDGYKSLDRAQILTAVSDSMSWQRLRVPIGLNLNSPKNISASASLTMDRGKSISLSVTFFGFEVGSLFINCDSVTVVDRMNKRYVSEPLTVLFGEVNVTVDDLQRLLLGRVANLDKTIPVSDFEIESYSPAAYSLVAPAIGNIVYGYNLDSMARVERVVLIYGDSDVRQCSYSSYTPTRCGTMPSEMKISVPLSKTLIEGSFVYKWDKMRIDGDVTVRVPSISGGYKRVRAEEIVKMLSSF